MIIKSINELYSIRRQDLNTYLGHVGEIIEYVMKYRDDGLRELTRKFDGVSIKEIVVNKEELRELAESIPYEVKTSLDLLYEYLISLHTSTLPKDLIIRSGKFSSGIIWRPISSVGIYVPGGLKAYPSTLLMAAVPARVAGVERLYVGTPPRRDGRIDAAVAYLSLKLNVSKVYRVGGAQIIAAMAFGTESVEKVDKIVGPGNIYVQLAKSLLQGIVSIDGVEGPTELLVIADETASIDEVCIDMEAQAEHGPSSIVALISTSDEILNKVELCLSRSSNKFFLIKVNDMDEAVHLVNSFAPEHLSVKVKDPYPLISKVMNVGAISVGKTPSAIIDYLGPNHILPTGNSAKYRGGLSVYDFVKTVMIADGMPERDVLRAIRILASYEGFESHSRSVGVCYGCP
ncbi:MAG: histidinol dehydrogenase [Sulfolobales archaeon]|nr:histidinol dehydrogenase [Sulfolobales archaeon]MDW7969944.1 histidinol dehydrogenase [Sulfolobales archaeon]